jgi:para-nitrobenzyl esterase
MLFTMQGRWIATKHITAKPASASYWYYFSYVPENLREEQPHGVPHGGEIVFPFQTGDTIEEGFTENDHAMAAKVSEFWFTFARDGVPTSKPAVDLITWPQLTANDDVVLKLGEKIETQQQFRKSRLDAYVLGYSNFEKMVENNRPIVEIQWVRLFHRGARRKQSRSLDEPELGSRGGHWIRDDAVDVA